jgi:hypothetical protein
MEILILACQMVADELNLAISRTGVKYPIIWIDSRLHEHPDKLQIRLQDEINRISNVQHIALAFGYCGNAVLGLKAKNASLVIPRVDDCISLLLGSVSLHNRLSSEQDTYYLTKGWLEYEYGILNQLERSINRYGQERACQIHRDMLQHYSRLILIDTGAYSVESCLEKVNKLAKVLGVDYEKIIGSGGLLDKLLQGPWDEDFSIIPLGSEVTKEHLWASKVRLLKCAENLQPPICGLKSKQN